MSGNDISTHLPASIRSKRSDIININALTLIISINNSFVNNNFALAERNTQFRRGKRDKVEKKYGTPFTTV